MPDATPPRQDSFETRMSHLGRAGKHVLGYVNPAVHRGSTVLYPTLQDRLDAARNGLEQAWVYGTHGGPTHHALEDVVADIEGGTRCQLVGSGLAAVTAPLLAFLGAGDHVLVPDSVYGPARRFCDSMLRRLGVTTTYYDPCVTPAALDALFRETTRVLYLESPGSHTFEVQDVPGLATVAHRHGATVLLDNTWGIHFFQPFTHGVDVSIQALTKYAGGHSDIILGAVTVATPEDWVRLRDAATALGQYASPDDCWLALRGIRSLGVRLSRQMQSGLLVARWLEQRSEVLRILHPALPGSPGHEIWERDFTGAPSLFGLVLKPEYSLHAMHAMIDSLELFGIGASWGGFESLVLPTTDTIRRSAGTGDFGGEIMRLHVGLEDPADLIADLENGFHQLREATMRG
jgi:cysteine-S-conjugate beta-lyase